MAYRGSASRLMERDARERAVATLSLRLGEQSLAAGYDAHSVVPYHIGAPRYDQAKPVLRVFRFRQGQTVAA